MASGGYGRGGRGAALLQALNAPVRKPGEQQQSPPQNGAATQTQPAAKPMGRGAFLQQILAAQQQGSAAPTQTSAAPAPVPTSTPMIPGGRGLVSQTVVQAPVVRSQQPAQVTPAAGVPATTTVRPVGRGLAALQALAAQSSSAGPPTVVPASPPQPPVTTPVHATSPVVPPVESGQHADADGEVRKTGLEMMLSRMKLDEGAIVRKGTHGRPVPVVANYIPVRCKNEGVFQYAVSFTPQVDSRNMTFKLLYEHLDVIGETKAFDGAILFLSKKLPNETVLHSKRPTDGEDITIRVKLVKVLPHASCAQLYNVVFRRIMGMLKMCQVGRHFYDPHRPESVPQHSLEVWPGYITAIQEYEGGLMLLTDVSHRVLRTETVLDVMQDLIQKYRHTFQDEVMRRLIGCTVLTRYNNRTYRIDDVAWDQSPMSTFEMSNGETKSFAEYYKSAYNKDIRDLQQPLLIHRPKKKDRIPGKKMLDVICLIPELSYMTGLSDDMRSDYKVMKDLALHTRVSPMQRQYALRKFCENINSHPNACAELEKWGLQLDIDTLRLEGRLLPMEKIKFRGRNTVDAGREADWGRAQTRSEVISAVDLSCWMVVFTKRDASKAQDFIQTMNQVCPQMGIQVRGPRVFELNNDRTETYIRTIRDNINAQVQLVVTIFPTSRDDRYNAIKKLCCVECPVPSQVINAITISKKPKLRSVVQKVALQINCKLGGELWSVEIPSDNLMVCGIDVFHDIAKERRSIGGFVASLNKTCTRWYSRVSYQMPGQELIDCLKVCFTASLRKYHEVNHRLPDRIIVYRDGVGDGQLPVVAGYEVKQLSECFALFGETYEPRLAVIVVQKRINTRIFARVGHGRDENLDNPPPGTIVDHTVTRKEWYDFFLVSQHVRQGTVSPTHYIVVHDDSDWKTDHMQRLTYKMTHLYYNWPGTVRVPAPCQYAHKLAYLVGQSIRKDPSLDLADRLFFL
ncbi:Piwi-like protein 2 [Lamellibrachia satsuma]|nr:Piwi-like protein 2 [Lamellibrachia satsuma]